MKLFYVLYRLNFTLKYPHKLFFLYILHYYFSYSISLSFTKLASKGWLNLVYSNWGKVGHFGRFHYIEIIIFMHLSRTYRWKSFCLVAYKDVVYKENPISFFCILSQLCYAKHTLFILVGISVFHFHHKKINYILFIVLKKLEHFSSGY